MHSKNIYQGSQIRKNGKVYDLEAMSWIFDCPCCEYILPCQSEEAATTTEATHFKISPSIHLEALKEANWDNSVLALTAELDEAALVALATGDST